jgi:hypothetical protein
MGMLALDRFIPVLEEVVMPTQNAQTGAGLALTGSGYCECVGYEPPERYAERALLYLQEHSKP